MSAPATFIDFLVRQGLADPQRPGRWSPLAGGVSSDIWLAELPDRKIVVKGALEKLRVEADWRAPVERNGYEWAWIETVRGIAPEAVPEPLAHDPEHSLFAMGFLAPPEYRNWREVLRSGDLDPGAAGEVGRRLAQIHAGTAGRDDLRRRFDTTLLFHDLRLSPYLFATAEKHPHLRPQIERLGVVTASTRFCLVHGDVSPKNILLGPAGPVFIDAECAWYGDPAFDVAFCLNHLVLGAVNDAEAWPRRLACIQALVRSYTAGVAWENAAALEQRVSALLPALMLARVAGKSPLDYLAAPERRRLVQQVASPFIATPSTVLFPILQGWGLALQRRSGET